MLSHYYAMSAVANPWPSDTVTLAVAAHAALHILDKIRDDSVVLAVWQRRYPHAREPALAALAADGPFDAVAEGPTRAAVAATLARLPCAAPRWLQDDIVMLAEAFGRIAVTRGRVRVRLQAIADPACWRWHIDAVALRLLCTYAGATTQYLPLGAGPDLARSLQTADPPCAPQALPRGAVALMKGQGFGGRGSEGSACIHRSPPEASPERPRLLLCLDEPDRFPTH
jgi:hypothetical protein